VGCLVPFFLWDIPISMHKFQVNLLRSWKLGSWSLKELDFWCVCACFLFFPSKFGAEGERQFRSAREREREREREIWFGERARFGRFWLQ
jgi:hypothetical protein